MTLQHVQSSPSRRERGPLVLGEQRPAHQDQAEERPSLRSARSQLNIAPCEKPPSMTLSGAAPSSRSSSLSIVVTCSRASAHALRHLFRSVAQGAVSHRAFERCHVDHPPSPRVAVAAAELERGFGKSEARISGHVELPPERHQVVTRRAEAVEQNDEWPVAASFAIGTPGDSNGKAG